MQIERDGRNLNLKSIQLTPIYLSRNQQGVDQIKKLVKFFNINVALPENDQATDFYFAEMADTVQDYQNLTDITQLVFGINEIDLIKNPGHIFITEQGALTTQQIFEGKKKKYATESPDSELWVLLSRFCNEHTAIGHIDILPEWLDKYVRYDSPEDLPDLFTNNVGTLQSAREILRLCLGMYPTKIEVDLQNKIPKNILSVLDTMPSWYTCKVKQLALLAYEFKEGDAEKSDGVFVQCSATKEDIVKLFEMYE